MVDLIVEGLAQGGGVSGASVGSECFGVVRPKPKVDGPGIQSHQQAG